MHFFAPLLKGNYMNAYRQYIRSIIKKSFVKTAKISDFDRVALTKREFDQTKLIYQQESEKSNKPSGFYYSYGEAWRNWLDIIGMRSLNMFGLTLDMSKMLVLTEDNFISFYNKYVTTEHNVDIVDWNSVYRDYNGIEVRDLWSLKDKHRSISKRKMPFLDTLDVNSGCFWNKSVLISATKIGKITDQDIEEIESDQEFKIFDFSSLEEAKRFYDIYAQRSYEKYSLNSIEYQIYSIPLIQSAINPTVKAIVLSDDIESSIFDIDSTISGLLESIGLDKLSKFSKISSIDEIDTSIIGKMSSTKIKFEDIVNSVKNINDKLLKVERLILILTYIIDDELVTYDKISSLAEFIAHNI